MKPVSKIIGGKPLAFPRGMDRTTDFSSGDPGSIPGIGSQLIYLVKTDSFLYELFGIN